MLALRWVSGWKRPTGQTEQFKEVEETRTRPRGQVLQLELAGAVVDWPSLQAVQLEKPTTELE